MTRGRAVGLALLLCITGAGAGAPILAPNDPIRQFP